MAGVFRHPWLVQLYKRRPWIGTKAAAGANKAITPAQINATSSVTASVTKLALIKPASINATSGVTASVSALRKVAPASISASSSVTATVTKLAAVKPAAINASSSVTASNPVVLRAVKPGSINSTSTVTASLVFLRAIKPTINATSFTSATLSGVANSGISNLTQVDPNVPQHVFIGAR